MNTSVATSAGVNYTVPPNLSGSGSKNNGGSAKRAGTSKILNPLSISGNNTGVFGSTVIDNEYVDKSISGGVIPFNNVRPVSAQITNRIAGVPSNALLTTSNEPSQLRSINRRENYRVSKVATAYRNGYWDPYFGHFQVYGTYSRSSNTVTVTAARHGLVVGDTIKLDFTSGTATDGTFTVASVADANTFTITHGTSGSTSGNVTVEGPARGTETVNTDTAAIVSRSSPGDLVFRTGAKLPVRNQDYKPKTG